MIKPKKDPKSKTQISKKRHSKTIHLQKYYKKILTTRKFFVPQNKILVYLVHEKDYIYFKRKLEQIAILPNHGYQKFLKGAFFIKFKLISKTYSLITNATFTKVITKVMRLCPAQPHKTDKKMVKVDNGGAFPALLTDL